MRPNLLAIAAAAAAPVPALADGADFMEKAVPAIVTSGFFASTVFVIALVTLLGHRARQLRHETIRLALEKGVQPPHELLEEPQRAIDETRDLRRGLTLLGLGVGTALCLYWLPTGTAHEAPWSLGFVPGLVGLGYLGTWFVRGRPTGTPRDGPPRRHAGADHAAGAPAARG
jgi:hypothetical protein